MANSTTNYGLTKPLATENYSIDVFNGNADKIDTALNGIDNALAIVANGNTHAAIAQGQYVYVHGHGSLAEGLYTANSAIAANDTLNSTNLTAKSGGIANEVKALNDHIATKVGTGIAFATEVDGSKLTMFKSGNVVIITGYLTFTSEFLGNGTIFTLPSGYKPNANIYALSYSDGYNGGNKTLDVVRVLTTGACAANYGNNNFDANKHLFMTISFCT